MRVMHRAPSPCRAPRPTTATVVKHDGVHVRRTATASLGWQPLHAYTVEYTDRGGRTRRVARELVDRGDTAVVLPVDPGRGRVLLTRQLRLGALLSTVPARFVVEAAGGGVDGREPAEAAAREAEEELGYRVHDVRLLRRLHVAPGLTTEVSHLFTARYSPADQIGPGGGMAAEGEDVEVLEMSIAEAVQIGATGVVDGRTALLLHLALEPLSKSMNEKDGAT